METRAFVAEMNKDLESMNDQLTDFMVSFNRLAAEIKEKRVVDQGEDRIDSGSDDRSRFVQAEFHRS